MRKKILAVLLVLALTFTVAVPTLSIAAAQTGSIKITGVTKDKVYDVYKIFDLATTGTAPNKTYSYTLDSKWKNFFIGTDAPGKAFLTTTHTPGLNQLIVEGTVYYINITEANVAAFANAAQEYALKTPVTKTGSGTATEDNSLTIGSLPLGYYLVYPEDAGVLKEGKSTICSLTLMDPDAEIEAKSEYPPFDKTVDDADAEVGQLVTYTVTSKVPVTEGYDKYEFTISDKMDKGLTFTEADADLTVKFGDTPITVSKVSTANAYITYNTDGYTLKFDMFKYQDYKGQTITITYKARVNKEAICEVTKNDVKLRFGHTPVELEDKEYVYTSKIVIDKYVAGSSSQKLSGAKFVLVKKDGSGNDAGYYSADANGKVTWKEYSATTGKLDSEAKAATYGATVKTTGADGACSFDGIKDGKYYLREIVSPEGYNLLDDDVEVTVLHTQKDQQPIGVSVTSEIANETGGTLPTTGGMGTTIFYLLGGLLVVGAAVAFITRRRMSADN